MKPLAMSFQLVIKDQRLHAEVEIVLEDGSTIFKVLPANERLTIHFDDLVKQSTPPPKAA
jgi:hypothetical protein